MKRMADNVDGAGKHGKRKQLRGGIRERSWRGPDGENRTAWQADFGAVNGKRLRKSFERKADAENWLHEQRLKLEAQGHAAFSLSDAERMDAVKAREELKDVADAKDNNLRPRSIADIEDRLKRFTAAHGDKLMTEITRRDAESWVKSIKLATQTKRHFRTVAHGLFNYAIDRKYISENPFAGNKHRRRHQEDEAMPVCIPWGDVQKIMITAVEREPSMVPGLAVGFFAGLRNCGNWTGRTLTWKPAGSPSCPPSPRSAERVMFTLRRISPRGFSPIASQAAR